MLLLRASVVRCCWLCAQEDLGFDLPFEDVDEFDETIGFDLMHSMTAHDMLVVPYLSHGGRRALRPGYEGDTGSPLENGVLSSAGGCGFTL